MPCVAESRCRGKSANMLEPKARNEMDDLPLAHSCEPCEMLLRQENRWWSVKLQSLGSKEHFLRYAGRYARRPPIAQRRITGISRTEITFWAKDKRQRRRTIVRLTQGEFLAAWMQHIPERYEHAVRSLGLFAPRAIRNRSAAVLTILGQSPRPRPRPISWNLSIKRDFGWDPLVDYNGNRMRWTRRIAPEAA